MTRSRPTVMSIAGTDPTGGAGIHADLKTILATGGYGMGAVTAVVTQNTCGVRSIMPVPPAVIDDQLRAVSDDVDIDAVKIGMLGDVATIEVVRRWVTEVRPPILVLDPVMVASSGDRLLEHDAENALRRFVAEAADLVTNLVLVTPNTPELAVLAAEPSEGSAEAAVPPVATERAEVLAQAECVVGAGSAKGEGGVAGLVVTGGHREGDEVEDLLVMASSSRAGGDPVKRMSQEQDQGRRRGASAGSSMAAVSIVAEASSPRIETTSTHGTGCTLSAALATIAARLQHAEPEVKESATLDDAERAQRWAGRAVRLAHDWLHGAVAAGPQLAVGHGHGPVDHGWMLDPLVPNLDT